MPSGVKLYPSHIAFPLGMRVGLELEFCSVWTMRKFKEFLPCDVGLEYAVGTDGSLAPKLGSDVNQLEIRTALPSSHVDVEILKNLLAYINQVNDLAPKTEKVNNRSHAFTTRQCGLHFHISWPSITKALITAHLINDTIVKKYKPFSERRSYCDPNYASHRGRRYNAIRQVEGSHFEVRIFNGTLKLRGITHWLDQIRDIGMAVESMDSKLVEAYTARGWPGPVGRPDDFDEADRARRDFVRFGEVNPLIDYSARRQSRQPNFIDELTIDEGAFATAAGTTNTSASTIRRSSSSTTLQQVYTVTAATYDSGSTATVLNLGENEMATT